jgi:small redox-active disulfide protein 2
MRKMQILGAGCGKCQKLYDNARTAVEQAGADCEVVKVTDIVEMLSFHALGLPALAIDGRVMASGRVLSAGQIKSLLGDM